MQTPRPAITRRYNRPPKSDYILVEFIQINANRILPIREGETLIKPLDDLTVIEVDNFMAAPSAAAILCDLGARVIKVEPLTGDPLRNTGRSIQLEGPLADHDYMFDVDNRGKESICVDLTQDDGRKLIHQLCKQADVFLCNLLPERQEKYGLNPETLHDVKATLGVIVKSGV